MSCLIGRRPGFLLLGVTLLAGWPGGAAADLVDTVARVKDSVLLVGSFASTASPRFGFRGTGFVVGAGNIAITNAHVLPEHVGAEDSVGQQIAVQVWSGPTKLTATPGAWGLRMAKVLVFDAAHDLALLSFEGPPVTPLVLAKEMPREGKSLAFMGFPIGGALGFSHVTHRGIISSIAPMALPAPHSRMLNARVVAELRRGSFNIYQLDATAYPGNSGGPVFDPDSGEVVGVINSVLVKGSREAALTHPSGISYAIPIEHARKILESQP